MKVIKLNKLLWIYNKIKSLNPPLPSLKEFIDLTKQEILPIYKKFPLIEKNLEQIYAINLLLDIKKLQQQQYQQQYQPQQRIQQPQQRIQQPQQGQPQQGQPQRVVSQIQPIVKPPVKKGGSFKKTHKKK